MSQMAIGFRQNRVYMVEAPIADAIAMGVSINRRMLEV